MNRPQGGWALCLAGCWMATVAMAQTGSAPAGEAPEVTRRQLQYHEHHRLELDGRTVSTVRAVAKILAASELEDAKQASLSVSHSAQQLQVLEAYTLKAGGRRIDVPRGSWQLRKSTGRSGLPPIFSDRDSTTLVYPELAVGDTVVLAYRISTREPLFPGKVSMSNSFSRAQAYDDVKVTVDAPVAMPLKTQAFEMAEAQSVQGGRRVTTWTWRHPVPEPDTRRDWSVVDVGTQPGYVLSSFQDWDDVARSYVERARPKAAVTPAVRELAQQVAGGQSTEAGKARALYDWVTSQVDYAGNCVGIGAVVPRDLSVVMQHRLGDCKDHATLLQALLAAQGIDSHQVLVNVGSLYRLPAVPDASMVNHVLNYLPSLQLFADSTSSSTSFGRLPAGLYGKPVLSDDPKVPRRLPADPGDHVQVMKTTLTVGDDGSVQGQVDLTLSGQFALDSRARFRRMDAGSRKDFVKNMFRRGNLQAEGTLSLDDPQPLLDRFHLAGTFRVEKALNLPGTGGLAIAPWFYNEAPAARWAQQAGLPVEEVDTVCSAGRSVEEYEITLPAAMRVVAVPEPVKVESAVLSYEASYRLDGQHLSVRRVLDDHSPAGVCGPDVMRAFNQAAQGVMRDLRQQLLYR